MKGLIGHDRSKTLDTIAQTLCDIGYTIDFNVLNSKYFGVPQNRERIFIIGVRNDLIAPEPWAIEGTNVLARGKRRIAELDGIKTFNFDWPEQEEVTVRLRDILESDVDEKYYLSEEKTARLIEQLNGSHEKQTEKFLIDDQGRTTKELRPLDISPTLRREMHGNEPRVVEPQMIGLCDIRGNESIRRVYSAEGISPTLTTMGGGHREPKIAVEYSRKTGIGKELDVAHTVNHSDWRGLNHNQSQNAVLEVRAVTSPEYDHKTQNGRRIKAPDEPMFTLTAQDRHGVAIGQPPKYRIRKLTPLECWRLQNFTDEQHDAVRDAGISDSQRYRQAGNAITVSVVEAIGIKMIESGLI